MATTIASQRAASRGAMQLLSRPSGKAKGRASLIYEMHSKLYPDLYVGKHAPVEVVNARKSKPKGPRTYILDKRPGQHDEEWKERFQRAYGDERMDRAIKHKNKLQLYPPKPAIQNICHDPIAHVTASQITLLDPTGARTRLFSKTNPECARVGDILLVRQRTGDPFAGVCINIRRRGADTAILLRGQLTRVGVEMWYKIYSPLVEGIEVVQRAQRRARRARLTYMRKAKHDRGSVENVVRMYLRQKAALGTAEGKKKGGLGGGMMGGKKGNKRGTKR